MLGNELRRLRLESGLTQEKLAAKARLSREYINYLENDKRSPTVPVFVRICRALRVSASEVLARVENRI